MLFVGMNVGVVVPSDIKLSVGYDLTRSLGCTNFTPGKGFILIS